MQPELPSFQIGQRVQIHRGPFSGCDAILEDLTDRPRIVVTIHLKDATVDVELDERWIGLRNHRTSA